MAFDGVQTAKQQLLDAKEILSRDGWCKGQRVNWNRERCALGLLDAVIGEQATFKHHAVVLLAHATGEEFSCQADYKVAEFNNCQGSVDSINAWFDRAIELA